MIGPGPADVGNATHANPAAPGRRGWSPGPTTVQRPWNRESTPWTMVDHLCRQGLDNALREMALGFATGTDVDVRRVPPSTNAIELLHNR